MGGVSGVFFDSGAFSGFFGILAGFLGVLGSFWHFLVQGAFSGFWEHQNFFIL